MNDKKYYPKGHRPEERGFSQEPGISIVDVIKQFAENAYEHQPGYFCSLNVVLVEREPEHPSPRVDDSEVTQPYSIN